MSRQLKLLLITLVFALSGPQAMAQTPTPEQIEQFKRLPRAQQEQLARQFGIDVSSLQSSANNSAQRAQAGSASQVYPRGTKFDEFGNPLLDMEEQKQEEELTLYGIDLFANEPTTFTPTINVPVPPDYVVGPGDEIVVQLFGKENQEHRLLVGRDGAITIPTFGPFNVASKSFSEVKNTLSEKIREQVIGVDVRVSMGELRSMRVFVMGEAYRPGAYHISSLSTITNALFVSGGVSEIASLRNIQLKRNGQTVTEFDLYDLLNNGDSTNDVQLRGGDVVFIPPVANTVTVDGQVRRPALYELNGETRLSQVINLAGGKLPEGFEQAISIKRFINGAYIQVTANLNEKDIEIKSGDIITVPKVTPFVSNSVTLMGAVARPGKYEYTSGMRISQLLGQPSKDLLEQADLTYVLILRDMNSNRDLEVLQTDLTRLFAEPDKMDVELQSNDRVLVFSKIESELLGDINLDDLAYTSEELEKREKEAWEKRIEEKLFWKSVGLGEESNLDLDDEELQSLQSQTLVELSETEKERVLEYRDATYFSRKRMLAPVIAKLREQAKFGQPLQLVEVAGQVKVPGLYPLTKGATERELIIAAGGLTESSYPLKSEITRTLVNGGSAASIRHITFSPAEAMKGSGTQALVSKDRINVFSIPSWQEELKVNIRGEVEFPGEYTIRRGESLADLLVRAGGLTSYGEPEAAIFTRESLKEQERVNLKNLTEELRKQIASESLRRQSGAGAMVSYDEAKKLLRDLTRAEPVGRLVIDFASLVDGNSNSDVILENGDSLYVPGKSQSVNVIGEVYVPTSHLFTSGLSYEDYISRSGGYRSLADKSNTYIIRANGSVEIPGRSGSFWFSSASNGSSTIMPGDTIVVPFDSDNVDNMTLWANATQIVYQLAVAVAAIGSL